ncbi:major facilitator superfamily domain-containing protein 6 [Caerostris darwini]|uniref:Major facilitator superfamily domain-containing protein 6 n=1 Tax=Caerostris darwini TaxID=1538125 RepID=A0AAV4R1M4_9ARAC|nr:major facilitator superfamily domain-containing protein 6 [Caerostris darwini]
MASDQSEKSREANASESTEKLVEKKSFWRVDKEMLRFKIHFFLYNGGLAPVVPFTIVFAKERLGLSATSLGAVLTAQMVMFIFTKPSIGYIADYFNRLKTIICVLTIGNIACYFLLLALPKIEREVKVPFDQNQFVPHKYNFSEISQNVINFTNMEATNSISHGVDSQKKICMLCSLERSRCLKASEQISDFNKTKNGFIETAAENGKNFTLFCTEDETLNISVDRYGHNSSNCHLFSNFTELFLSEILETNATHQDCDISMCFLWSTNFTKVFLLYNTNDFVISTNNFQYRTVSDFETYQFWLFAILFSISAICTNAIFTLSDTACCETIQKTGGIFGRQRMWGSIGWGILGPVAGVLNDYTGGFIAAWSVFGVAMILFLLNMTSIDLVKPHFSQNILRDVGTVLKSKEFLIFEAVIFMNGVGTGIIWFYLVWFLRSIGGSELLCGLTLTVQSFGGAIPLMFFSGWIIRKVGHFPLLMAGLFTYLVRFLWYSYLTNPWWILPVEIGHGLTYGLYYTVLASYGKLSAKPGTEATTQAILFSTHEGLGASLGCVFAGVGFDYLQGHRTFFILSAFFAAGFGVSLFLRCALQRQTGALHLTSADKPQA